MTARTALREMRTLMENVNRGVVPKPPQWTDKEITQVKRKRINRNEYMREKKSSKKRSHD